MTERIQRATCGHVDERDDGPAATQSTNSIKRTLRGLDLAAQQRLVEPRGPLPPLRGAPAVQMHGEPGSHSQGQEPQGAWENAKDLAAASFGALADRAITGVESFRPMLDERDPPRGGWNALVGIVDVVAGVVLGRLGERIVDGLFGRARSMVRTAFSDLTKHLRSAAQGSLRDAIAGAGEELPASEIRRLFMADQTASILEGIREAKDRFIIASGGFELQLLGIDDMEAIRANNLALLRETPDLVLDELIAAWLNLLAGDDGLAHDNIENTHRAGVLRLVVVGQNDKPTEIRRATLYGGGPHIRALMGNTTLGDWLASSERRGLNVTFRSDPYGYTLSPETTDAAIRLGVLRERDLGSTDAPCAYFSFAVLPGGTIVRDDDPRGRRGPSQLGAWLLDRVTPPREILDAARSLPLPEIDVL